MDKKLRLTDRYSVLEVMRVVSRSDCVKEGSDFGIYEKNCGETPEVRGKAIRWPKSRQLFAYLGIRYTNSKKPYKHMENEPSTLTDLIITNRRTPCPSVDLLNELY